MVLDVNVCGSATSYATCLHQAIIVVHEQVALYLLQCIQDNTYTDQHGRTTVERCETTYLPTQQRCNTWQNTCYSGEEACTRQRNPIHDRCYIVGRRLTWFYTRDKAVITLQVISHFSRIKNKGCIEVRKCYYQYSVDQVIPK